MTPTPPLTPASTPTAPVILLTGATGGLGTALAQTLAARGTRLGITARTPDTLHALARRLAATGADVVPLVCDAADPADAEAATGRLIAAYGRIDALIANAGVEGPVGPTWELPLDDWWSAVRTNLLATAATAHTVLPHMVRQRSGRIVSVSSAAGHHRWPTLSAYSVSKAAGIKYIENIAYEARAHNIQAFSLHPGLLPTGLSTTALAAAPTSHWHERRSTWVRNQLADGHGTPVHRAVDAVIALLDGDADHRSGSYLTVEDVLDTDTADQHLPDAPTRPAGTQHH
ncbi:SDR family NAD(P)-dependent oxidoreductase [Streptomyces sp. NPDC059477]|uniref:SDR family NAD(P)-dependent oxidoreductase n=1 Tax=Streptomyces sp. NPDC059477 TaxID=3346847 RepID=UPI0036BB6D42